MKDISRFLDLTNGREVFVHEFLSAQTAKIYILLNPLFDEKKKTHTFQSNLCRSMYHQGKSVIRFDYYGTGDSNGHTYEQDLADNAKDINILINYYSAEHNCKEITLLGIRWSCFYALKCAENSKLIKSIICIEPVLTGIQYLKELRARRTIFFKTNRITSYNVKINIDSKEYEDFQGYPLSMRNIEYLEKSTHQQINISNKTINFIKLRNPSSIKGMNSYISYFSKNNQLLKTDCNIDDFWASLEPIDTRALCELILKC